MNTDVREPSAKYLPKMGLQPTMFGPIPSDWTLSTVGAEFSVQLGKMLDSERNVGIGKPYLGNKAVQWGRVDVSEVQIMRMSKADLDKFRLQFGDLLVCEGGEVGRAAIWNAPIGECYYQKALHRLRPLRGYDPRLMLAVLQLWVSRGVLANYVTQTSIAHLPKEKFVAVPIPLPPPEEQCAIATALSDVDALIAGLERLIAKKRDIKQAAMQQLLTGQTRLPGFSGEWDTKFLGNVCRITTGKKDVNEGHPNGQFPFFTCSRTHTFSHGYSFDTEAILIAGNGEVGNLHYFNGKFEAYQRTYILCEFSVHVRFLWQQLSSRLVESLGLGKIGSSIPYIKKENLTGFEFLCPQDLAEQTAIAAVLSDMDADLSVLETRLAKTRAIKQGVMQELLTGRTRLI